MNSVLKISEASSIAFHSLGVLAHSEKKLNVKEISEHINASVNHLSKVMQRLVKSGIVGSTRGPHGGFYLVKKPDKITLLDIYEIIEGEIQLHGCPLSNGTDCPFKECMFGGITLEITKKFKDFMSAKTIAEI